MRCRFSRRVRLLMLLFTSTHLGLRQFDALELLFLSLAKRIDLSLERLLLLLPQFGFRLSLLGDDFQLAQPFLLFIGATQCLRFCLSACFVELGTTTFSFFDAL